MSSKRPLASPINKNPFISKIHFRKKSLVYNKFQRFWLINRDFFPAPPYPHTRQVSPLALHIQPLSGLGDFFLAGRKKPVVHSQMAGRLSIIKWPGGCPFSNGRAVVHYQMAGLLSILKWPSGCPFSNGRAVVHSQMAERLFILKWPSGCPFSNGRAVVHSQVIIQPAILYFNEVHLLSYHILMSSNTMKSFQNTWYFGIKLNDININNSPCRSRVQYTIGNLINIEIIS